MRLSPAFLVPLACVWSACSLEKNAVPDGEVVVSARWGTSALDAADSAGNDAKLEFKGSSRSATLLIERRQSADTLSFICELHGTVKAVEGTGFPRSVFTVKDGKCAHLAKALSPCGGAVTPGAQLNFNVEGSGTLDIHPADKHLGLIEFANSPGAGCLDPGKKQFLSIARSNLKSVKK